MGAMGKRIPRRPLGKTGLGLGTGPGGFHQVEVGQDTVDAVVDLYLAAGELYRDGTQLWCRGLGHKLGRALGDRRDVILASKTGQRGRGPGAR